MNAREPFEIHTTEQPRYFLRLNAAAITEPNPDLEPLLEQLASQTGADGVVVYRLDSGTNELAAIAAQANASPRIPELGVTLGAEASAWLRRSRGPVQTSP